METCTVGGTRESNVWDTEVKQKDIDEVMERACKVVPSLRVRTVVMPICSNRYTQHNFSARRQEL